MQTERIELTACTVDLKAEQVARGDEVQRLTTREARLLAFLVHHAGRDVARDAILTEVWGYAAGVVSRAVDAAVNRLRAKIERDPAEPDHLLTVWGHGYRLELLPGAASVPASRSNLGPELDRFVGREQELARLTAALGATRLLTLCGPPGIGKTRLARRAARSRSAHHAGGAWFVEAEQARTAEDLARLVAAILEPGLAPEALGPSLARRGPTLLVLDNLEQAVDGAATAVARWLRTAPELVVLATSRERLGIAGEALVELGPLDAEAARALFEARAPDRSVLRGEELDEVLQRLEGIPLAVELAAALTDVLDLQRLLRSLERPLDVLRSSRRDRPDRHRTLRSALDGSWATLDEAERHVLASASVFRGGFTPEQLARVAEVPVLEPLRGLRAKSLVRRLPDHDALGLYEVVRAYAAERLRERGDEAEALRRLGDVHEAGALAREL